MAGLAESGVGDLLAGLASATDTRAAGVASALTCAIAASLVELTAELAAARIACEGVGLPEPRLREIAGRARELRERLPAVADEDVVAYAAVGAAETAEARDRALARAMEPPREVAGAAGELAKLAAEVAAAGDWPFTPDAVVAGQLADAAAAAAAELIEANETGMAEPPAA